MALAAVKIAALAGLAAVYPERLRGGLIAIATCIAAAFALHFAAP